MVFERALYARQAGSIPDVPILVVHNRNVVGSSPTGPILSAVWQHRGPQGGAVRVGIV